MLTASPSLPSVSAWSSTNTSSMSMSLLTSAEGVAVFCLPPGLLPPLLLLLLLLLLGGPGFGAAAGFGHGPLPMLLLGAPGFGAAAGFGHGPLPMLFALPLPLAPLPSLSLPDPCSLPLSLPSTELGTLLLLLSLPDPCPLPLSLPST